MPQAGSGQIDISIIPNNHGGAPQHSTVNGGQTSTTHPTANGGHKSTAHTQGSDHLENTNTGNSNSDKSNNIQHKFLSNTAKLGYFFPTGTSTLFQTIVPKIYMDGRCSYNGRIMMWLLLMSCVAICFFSQFAHSEDGKNKDGKKKYYFTKPKSKSGWFEDGAQIIISAVAFLTIAFSDERVVDCVLPAHVKDVQQVMLSLQIMVLSVCSFLYTAFRVRRAGFVPKVE